MKKALGVIALSLLVAAPAAAETVQSKYNLSIGGFVKLDYAYNSVNLGINGALLPNGPIAKTHTAAATSEQSILTARQSRFWLKSDGPELFGAKTSALIEADFYGDGGAAGQSPQLRMRHAYAAIDGANTQVLFGQFWDVFGPAVANTQDFRCGAATGAPNNPRVPQLRVTQKIPFSSDNALKLVIAMQDPSQGDANIVAAPTAAGTPTYVAGTSNYSYAPNFAGQVMFDSAALGKAPGYAGALKGLSAGLFGLYGSMKTPGVTQTIDSWGYGVYAFVPVLKSSDGKSRAMTASLEAQAYMAANMNFNAATGNTVLAPNGAQSTVPAKGYGLYAQAIVYPTQDLGVTAGWGRRNAYNEQAYKRATTSYERTNELLYANIAYDLNAAVRVATEFEHQKTVYGGTNNAWGNDLGQDNTFRLCAYYFF